VPPAGSRRPPPRHPTRLAAVAVAALGLTVAVAASALGPLAPSAAASQQAGRPPGAVARRSPLGPLLDSPRATAARVPPLRLPVRGPVVRGFEPPSGRYGPGHRGVDLAAPLGTPVVAPAAGRTAFAGPVAGLGWVSLEVAPGVVVTVGPLDRPTVHAGQAVPALARLGRLAPGHDGRLHLGLRVDGAYVDPLPYLVGDGPPRLAPLDLPGAAASP
jgi:murein DD-endopeptidase MepM/ murein hydrolase activator NlpD